ncbi:MAG: DUF3078 domain-containing protein [Chitinispirillaceae bacterium]|nr:DUF3078 domain-containing protein [Chitinispirillaceae bacterium]
MKKIVVSLFFLSAAVFAADDPWHININSNLTTTLNTYTDNWTGGEAGSFTWASQLLGVAERQLTEIINTKATLKLQFGQTKIQDKTSKVWSIPQKSTDLIDGEELLRFMLNTWVDPFISVRAISQFVDGSDLSLTRYGNPLDITESVGVSRTLQKSENIDWSVRLGAAARQLVDRKQLQADGSRETDITNDGGAEINMDLKAINQQKWATLLSSLRIYEALVSSKSEEFIGTDMENDWRYPHVKWDNTLTLTFAKYLMVNLSAYLLYDKEISDEARIKQTFAAGLTYLYIKN